MNHQELQNCPDFFVVGAPKCATSSLHALMIAHPDIFMCSPKEPQYFSTDMPGLAEVNTPADYDALFENAAPSALKGDASAFYLSSFEAAQNIYAANPNARIIISIRNPADAVQSWFSQLRDGFRENQPTFEKAWALQDARSRGEGLPDYCPEPRQLQYRDLYSYHDQIKRYFDVFGRDAVKVIMVEDIKMHPEDTIRDLMAFIGVQPQGTEMPKTNTRRQARFPGLNQMLASPPGILKPLVKPVKAGLNKIGIKPSELVMKYMSKKGTQNKQQISTELRKELADAFADDVERLENLLQRDLTHWKAAE